jgi:hypothetical protein
MNAHDRLFDHVWSEDDAPIIKSIAALDAIRHKEEGPVFRRAMADYVYDHASLDEICWEPTALHAITKCDSHVFESVMFEIATVEIVMGADDDESHDDLWMEIKYDSDRMLT